MEDKKLDVAADITEQLAEGMEQPAGLSRRERRRLAEAAKAEAAKAEAEKAPATPSLFDDEIDASDTTEVEEPTRIFTPISKREPEAEKPQPSSYFAYRAEEESKVEEKSAGEETEAEDETEDETEDEKQEEKKPRRGLFGRKRAEDEGDEDEEDDEEDEDEDDEDDEDDYDRMDDEDDDDEDDEHRSFGYHLINFFKGLLEFVLVLLILVLALNVLDFFNVVSLDGAYARYYDKAPKVFDTLFPSHALKSATATTEPAATEAPATGFEAAPAADETQVAVTDAPATEEAPATGDVWVDEPAA